MRTLRSLFTFTALALVASTASAWNAVGHETVAAIAWANMKPQTRTRVAQVLNGAVPGDCLHEMSSGGAREYFIRSATWPDVVRPKGSDDVRPCTQFHREIWHFFDHFWSGTSGATGDDAPRDRPDIPLAATNAVERLQHLEPLVACATSPCASPMERAHDLAWVAHLIGDIHQPLHNAARVTGEAKETQGDRGGNLFLFVKNDNPGNLHSFWDGIVNASVPRHQGESEIAYVTRVAAKIQHDHPRASVAARLDDGHPDDWSNAGLATAKAIAYPASLHRNVKPSDAYRRTVFSAADEAIALAGYRLADTLDEMFAASH